MPKTIYTTKLKPNQTLFDRTYSNLTSFVFDQEKVKVFQWLSISKYLSFMNKFNPNNANQTKSDIFLWDIFKSDVISFFYQEILKCFNDLQNKYFPVLRIAWTQTMEMKQNQTFFHDTYSNLTPYHFLSKNNEVFQWLSKSKFLSFMNKVNPNNGNETKSDIFSCDIFKSDIIL